MEKKAVSEIMLTLLLAGMMTLAFNVQPARSDWAWTETIYIRADGSIDPDTAPISTVDYVTYILTDNITGDVPEEYSAIVVEKDSIVIDGAGYSVQGTGSGTGIDLSFRHNVTLKNVKVTSFKGYGGIRLYNSDNNTIAGNSVSNMVYPGMGIHLISSSNNIIIDNNAYSSGDSAGIRLYKSSDNKIAGNTLTDSGSGIALDSSNNNTLSGNNAYLNSGGISIYYSFNNTINGNAVYLNSGSGIALESSSNNTLAKNNAYLNTGYGFHLWGGSNNVFVGNNASSNGGSGFFLISTTSNNLTDNNALSNSEYGISLSLCREYVLSRNTVSDNLFNFDVYGSDFSEFNHYIDTSNTVDGKPIYYLMGLSDAIYDTETNAGTIYLINCNNITIRDLNLTENGNAVFFFNTTDSTIQNITASNNECGINLCSSSNNTIDGNTVYSNEDYGICLESSNNNTLSDNNASSSTYGITLDQSSENTIYGNIITSNVDGIILGSESKDNLITGNSVSDNQGEGIHLGGPRNNLLFHNNFINNAVQAYAAYSGYINTWDSGYPSGGNYWSDYSGTDQYGGSGQDQLGSDGIGDAPYVIDADNRDRYPLMNPWTPLEHELIASIMAPASITIGRSSLLNATVMNLGLNDEVDAELHLLINGTVVDSTTIAFLKVRNSYTLSYLWTPTAEGTYNVTAHVPSLPEEGNKENNQATEFVAVYVPQPPVASFTCSPTAPIAGKTVTFDASASYDPDGSIISYDWEFGDGTTGSGKIVTHAYANAGSYTVTLTITDNEDVTDTETSTITILIAPKIGVKTGDWIKVEYTISGAPSGTPLPQWLKVEFLNVEGTNATVRVTMHMTDGTEPSQTMTIDVAVGSGAFQGLSGFVIPANCTTGDFVYVSGYGNLAVAGETARNYAGASRTVVYASISQLGSQLTYYWDKQTGIMVEATTVSGTMTASGKATETNLWQAQSTGLPIDPTVFYILIIAAIAIVAGVAFFAIRRKKKPPKEAILPQS